MVAGAVGVENYVASCLVDHPVAPLAAQHCNELVTTEVPRESSQSEHFIAN